MSTVEKVKDSWEPQSYPIPKHWKYVGIDSFFSNISLSGKKLPQKEYLETGSFPVVDQGANLIGGFSNDEDKVISTEIPVVVFGDHTKCLKYITFSFIPGADGIKVLQPKGLVNPKYAFFACQSLKLPDRGYSRHFSFLKKSQFPLAPLEEQKSIVAKIEELFSELDSGIASLKTAQEQLKIYRQALLKHAFEGKLTEQWRKDNADKLEAPEQLLARIQTERETRYQQQLDEWKQAVKDWEAKGKEGKKPSKPVLPKSSDLHANDAYQRIGGLPASWAWLKLSDLLQNSPQNGLYKPSSFYGLGCQIIRIDNFYDGRVTDKQSLKRLAVTDNEKDTYGLKLGDLIVNRVNSIEYLGKSALIRKLDEPIVFESNIMRCTLLSKTIEREFIVLYLNTIIGRKELCKNAKHAVNQASINQTDVGNSFLPICSLAEQQEIVNLLEEKLSIIERNEKEIENALAKAELLRQSILKKAFSGRLS